MRSVLEKDKLNGKNFLDWYRNLRIVLKQEKKQYVLDEALPAAEPASDGVTAEKIAAYRKHVNDSNDVTCLMLATMESDLQKQFEEVEAFEMVTQLKEMFQVQARTERYNMHNAFTNCKMAQGTPVAVHVLKMKGYIDNLEKLGAKIDKGMAIDVILGSLTPNYGRNHY